jgi:hypothetical protein
MVIATIALALNQMQTEGQDRPKSEEQRQFSAEDEGARHPVSIPAEVMTILGNDKRVQSVAENENIPMDKVPSEWFSASAIHLGGPDRRDLIVVARGPLAGANVDVFWVFIHEKQGFRLALMVPAHDLVVKSARTHGYRNIEASGATANTITTAQFKFDGETYEEYVSTTDDIK